MNALTECATAAVVKFQKDTVNFRETQTLIFLRNKINTILLRYISKIPEISLRLDFIIFEKSKPAQYLNEIGRSFMLLKLPT